jgi:hypothetical protein
MNGMLRPLPPLPPLPPYAALGLGDPALSDDQLLDAMIAHPILINRPIVVSAKGVKLSRPSEAVLDLLPPQLGCFRQGTWPTGGGRARPPDRGGLREPHDNI